MTDAEKDALIASLQAQLQLAALSAPAPAPSGRAACAFKALACVGEVLRGLRTLLFFGVSGGLAVLQEFGAIDITPVLQLALPEGAKINVSQAIMLMSMGGIALRLITKTPAFERWRSAAVGTGSTVDEPVGH